MITKFDQFLLEKRIILSLIPKPSPNCEELIKKFGTISEVNLAMNVIVSWWRGNFMGVGNDDTSQVTIVEKSFKKIGQLYHVKKLTGKFYRATHLRTPGAKTKDEILKITSGTVANKTLQSWSSTFEGAKLFFNVAYLRGNHMAQPQPDKAWVIVESDGTELEQITTYDEVMQFIADFTALNPAFSSVSDDLAEQTLFKVHELICIAKKENEDFKVVDVLVLPEIPLSFMAHHHTFDVMMDKPEKLKNDDSFAQKLRKTYH